MCEAVEVVGRERPAHSRVLGNLVLAHRIRLRDDELVEGPAQPVGETRDRVETRDRTESGHGRGDGRFVGARFPVRSVLAHDRTLSQVFLDIRAISISNRD